MVHQIANVAPTTTVADERRRLVAVSIDQVPKTFHRLSEQGFLQRLSIAIRNPRIGVAAQQPRKDAHCGVTH